VTNLFQDFVRFLPLLSPITIPFGGQRIGTARFLKWLAFFPVGPHGDRRPSSLTLIVAHPEHNACSMHMISAGCLGINVMAVEMFKLSAIYIW